MTHQESIRPDCPSPTAVFILACGMLISVASDSVPRTIGDGSGQQVVDGRSPGPAVLNLVANGGTDAAVQNLTLSFSTCLGGNDEDTVRDVFVDDAGFVYLTGGTRSTNFPTTAGAFDRTMDTSGSPIHDVFVTKLSPSGTVVWSTLLGGPNYDRAYAIEVDHAGFVYVAGRAGPGFPTTAGVLQPDFAGDVKANTAYGRQDGFVAKLSPDGSSLVWATYFGDADRTFVRDLDIDAAGNVYIVLPANTTGQNPHITAGAFQTTHAGGSDGIVAKLSAGGTAVIWASYLGGSGTDLGTPSIRVNALGEAVVLGYSDSSDMPSPVGSYDRTYNGGGDLHVAKFSADGSQLLYGTFIGGSDVEFTETHGLALDAAGNAYVAATTKSTNVPATSGAFQKTYGGTGGLEAGSNTNYPGDGFVVKISADGSTLLAATYLGGRYGEGIEGVSVLSSGGVFVAGTTFSDDFPATSDAYQGSGGTAGDMFGALLSGDLSSVVYATYLGGTRDDYGRSATTDSNGFVYVVGQTKSTNWPTLNALQTGLGGRWDGGIAKFSR